MNPLVAQSLSLSVSFCLCASWETCLWLACVSVCMCGVYCICVLSHEWTLGLVGWSSLSWQRYVGWTKPRYLLPRQTDRQTHTAVESCASTKSQIHTRTHTDKKGGKRYLRMKEDTTERGEINLHNNPSFFLLWYHTQLCNIWQTGRGIFICIWL